MNSEVVFLKDGSFKLPYDLKELFAKGMAYTILLKVGEGIVFLPRWQMGYIPEIPLKYDEVKEDGYLRIPIRMMQLFQKYNFTMICSAYSSLGHNGVLLTDKPNFLRTKFLWKRSDVLGVFDPWEIPHRSMELVIEERKREGLDKYVVKRRKTNTEE